MSLKKEELTDLLSYAKSAAIKAGQMIKNKSRGYIQKNYKQVGSELASQIVTEIDLLSERIILDELRPTFELYKLGLLTEENTENRCRFSYDYFWCIDPLDGTLNFSRNESGHSISIALVSKSGDTVIGVVFDNNHEALYWSVKGEGAYKNGETLKIIQRTSPITLLTDHSFESEDLNLPNNIELYSPGGAVMNAILTIEKAPAIYFKRPKLQEGGGSLWDFAASSLIQAEAGGFNGDFNRRPLDLNKKNSTFMNKEGVIYSSSEKLLSEVEIHRIVQGCKWL